MKKYNLINNITGWIAFFIAAFTFLSTIEPTTSFWDCGEFIATAFKLEVGHPPGAPLFMIMGRFVSLFASDVEQVPVMMNAMSAIASAFTILFLFWTVTYLAKKIIVKNNEELSLGQTIAIIGSGLIGALSYTWSDTFWFSAVEAEVYSTSSFFTAIVLWAIIKWEQVSHEKYSNRWIILIAYLMGLSIGVHLLNLLAIPAIVFVYYFKNYTPTRKGVITSFSLSVIILAFIMYVIVPYTVVVATWFELLFVNGLGMPFNSGVLFYVVLLVASLVFGVYYTRKKGKVLSNTIIVATMAIFIGYSSYSMIILRSLADPPLNENKPNNVFSLLSYLNREQYGDRPLLYGQSYNAPQDAREPFTEGKTTYYQQDGKYVETKPKEIPNYDSRFKTIFPRMYSSQLRHVRAYKSWADVKGKPIKVNNETIYAPTFGENIKFFFKYQIGHMYLRYFMWNFSGRQNDIQGHGSVVRGNWISGIPFIDEIRLGSQDNLPSTMTSNNAMNKYFMLPLLLGLVGLFFQYKKDKNNFWVVMLMFLFTGLAIVFYLNQYPNQPRERDYAYAGSFYAFAIWIGLGVLALYDILSKKIPQSIAAGGVTAIAFVLVPGILVSENWDDHDRSGRYTARDFAYNYLNSCEPNAIIFTNGDNDTFPLWYAQEVEGIRTDIRVVNLSLFNTDWYIDQMKKQAYEAPPVPISYSHEQYMNDIKNYVPVYEQFKDYKDINQVNEFVKSDVSATRVRTPRGEELDFIPTKKISIPVDVKKVLANGTVSLKDSARVETTLQWEIKKSYLTKGELMILDIIANNNWDRPIYFAITVGSENFQNLEKYFSLDGLAYRLVPIEAKSLDGQIGEVNTEAMYDNMMNKFKWGGINDPNVYLDENNLRMIMNFRNNFARLAKQLIQDGEKEKAKEILDKCTEVMPVSRVPLNLFAIGLIEGYYQLGDTVKANSFAIELQRTSEEELAYYFSLDSDNAASVDGDKRKSLFALQEVTRMAGQYNQKELFDKFNVQFQTYYQMFNSK